MFGSAILEAAIGLVFVYGLLSLICSSLNEMVAGVLATRAKYLEQGIRNLLDDAEGESLAATLYGHPLVAGLSRGRGKEGGRRPSYIPSRVFAGALLDVIVPAEPDGEAKSVADIRDAVSKVESEEVKRALLALVDEAGEEINALRESVERWFDDAMDRISGWYKRRTQFVLLVLAFVVTFGLNVDTLDIGNSLLRHDAVRAAVVAAAEGYASGATAEEPAGGPQEVLEGVGTEIEELGLPIGWSSTPKGWGWLWKAVGLVITTLAVSLGAPFWFDVMNKLVSLRAAGARPATAARAAKGGSEVR